MLQDKCALVTGGASGIGRAVCHKFASHGAIVAVVDVNGEGAAKVASELGANASSRACDIADSAAAAQVVREIEDSFGRLDILANIAGVDDPGAKKAISDASAAGRDLDITATLTDEQWRRIMSINLDGTFFVTRAVLAGMQARRSGVVVNMASVAGITGVAGLAHYSASKAGIIGFTRALAREVAGQGIRVNAIAPGLVETPMASRGGGALQGPLPMGKVATADQVASIALFLASDLSEYVTGETINVSGGVVIP